MFMSKEQLAILNKFRDLTALSLDLNMKLLAGQILHKDAKKVLEYIAFEQIDLEKRLKEIDNERKKTTENTNQISMDVK